MTLRPTITLPVDPAAIGRLRPGDSVLHGGSRITTYVVQGEGVTVYTSEGNLAISAPPDDFDPSVSIRIAKRLRAMAAGRFG